MITMSSNDENPAIRDADGRTKLQQYACSLCQLRKVKCDRTEQCSNCRKANTDCIYKAPGPRKKRKRRTPEELLKGKLARYEELLRLNGVEISPRVPAEAIASLSPDPPAALRTCQTIAPKGPPDAAETPQDSQFYAKLDIALKPSWRTVWKGGNDEGEKEEDEELDVKEGRLIQEKGTTRYLENSIWKDASEELQNPTEMLRPASSDEEESEQLPVMPSRTGPEMLLFGGTPNTAYSEMAALPQQLPQLWEVFMNRVDPLVKVLHAPTVKGFVDTALQNPASLEPPGEALLFAVCIAAVNALEEDECHVLIGEKRGRTLAQLDAATMERLRLLKFLKSTDLVVLQAFAMLLLARRSAYDPHTLFSLTGIASRFAQRIGIHRDGAALGLNPWETEVRRRLWWKIFYLDCRAAEDSGCGNAFGLGKHPWSTKLPLNINDSDIWPSMRGPLVEREGATDMIFDSVMSTTGSFLKKHRAPDSTSYDGLWTSLSSTALSNAEKDRAIDEHTRTVEEKILRYVDPSMPLHYATAIAARWTITKMRMVAHHPRSFNARISEDERSFLYTTSLKLIEYQVLVATSELVRPYRWLFRDHFQWHGLIWLLRELARRTSDTEQGWTQIDAVYKHFPKLLTDRGPLFAAVRSLTLKADAVRQKDSRYQVPDYILELLAQEDRQKQKNEPSKASRPTEGDVVMQGSWMESSDAAGMFDYSSGFANDWGEWRDGENLFGWPAPHIFGNEGGMGL